MGRYIDARDSVNAWCLGEIVEVTENSIKVHFDGWSARWDTVKLIYLFIHVVL